VPHHRNSLSISANQKPPARREDAGDKKMQTSILQAIRTKYHGPTDHRGSRVTATSGSGCKLTIPMRHDLSHEQCHRVAAEMLAQKLAWPGTLIQGGLQDGYVFVFAP
jgi:hypothetical protein